MKKIILFHLFLIFYFLPAQEIDKIKKIKIGKFDYEMLLEHSYNIERNFDILSYSIKLYNNKQNLGTYLVYRKTGASKNYLQKVDENHPLDSRSFLKDGIILIEGNIDINEAQREITILEQTTYKDEGFEDDPDCLKRIYKQNKNGFFVLKQISEYRDGKEIIVLKK